MVDGQEVMEISNSPTWLIMMGWEYVLEPWPPTGLLFIPRVIMSMDNYGGDDAGWG
jgi:hypothetical protein